MDLYTSPAALYTVQTCAHYIYIYVRPVEIPLHVYVYRLKLSFILPLSNIPRLKWWRGQKKNVRQPPRAEYAIMERRTSRDIHARLLLLVRMVSLRTDLVVVYARALFIVKTRVFVRATKGGEQRRVSSPIRDFWPLFSSPSANIDHFYGRTHRVCGTRSMDAIFSDGQESAPKKKKKYVYCTFFVGTHIE